jgi:hypothetical protein
MGSVILGIILAFVGILLWVGVLTLTHAMAIFLISTGIALILFYSVPHVYTRRP